MSAFHCVQPHGRAQEARGSDPQLSQPGRPGHQARGPADPHPQPGPGGHQARGPTDPDPQRGQPGDRAQEAPRSEPDSGPPGDPVRGFFDVFARSSNPLDLDALAGCFDETFLASDAAGARVVPRPAFLRALAGRAQMFADAGIGPAALRQLTCQELDPHHVLASTTWAAPRMDGSGEVTLASSFLLRRDGDQLRIVVYINHQGLPAGERTAGAAGDRSRQQIAAAGTPSEGRGRRGGALR